MRDLIWISLLFSFTYSLLSAQQETPVEQPPAAETFAARVDTINLVFNDYFWTEATRPEGLAKLERLYDRDLAAGRRDSVTAATLSGLGQFHLAIDGHHNRAERFHRSALELVDSLYAFPNSLRASYRMYLAELFIQQDPRMAGGILQESIKELQALEVVDHNFIQGNYWNLSRSFTQAGEYQPARDAIELALDDWRTYMPDNPHNGGRLYNQLSQVLLSFERDLPVAVDAAVQALELSRLTRYPFNVGYGYNNLGTAYLVAGQVAAADSVYREMLSFTTENKDLNELRASAHVNLSETSRQLGQPTAALEHARTALRLMKKYSPVTVHNAYAAVAASENLLGRPQAALDAANSGVLSLAGDKSAMDGDRRVFSASDAYDFDELVHLLEQRIMAFRALDRPRSAQADYDLLISTQNAQRRQGQDAESRRVLSYGYRSFYDDAVSLAYNLPNRTEADAWRALGTSDAARGFSLLAELRDRQGQLAERETGLLQSIAEYERIEKPSAGERRILANQRNQLLELRRTKNSSVPVDSTNVNLRDFLESQSFSTIEFMMTDSACFAFIHQPGQPLAFRRVGKRADIDRLASAWRMALAASAYRGKSLLPEGEQAMLTAEFDQLGEQLSNLLFGGYDLAETEELVIITDGELHFLPFGALPFDSKYLVDHFPVRYAYSLRHLQELGTISRPENDGNVLAIAPSFGGSAAPLIASRSGGDLGLRPLANNVSEVEAIGNMLKNSVVLTRSEATRDSFFALAEKARIIHLSSHGVVDPRNPNRSFIAFTQTADTLQGEELLYFNDLTRLSLAAEMVTLSACETNLGEVVPGEHVLSMGGAFAAAGARSTVSTLWQVDDAATTLLMQRFYEELAAGTDRTIALQRAQQYLREETDYEHPYYWAGFTLHGVNGTLELATADFNLWLLGGITAAGLGLGLLFGLRRSRA